MVSTRCRWAVGLVVVERKSDGGLLGQDAALIDNERLNGSRMLHGCGGYGSIAAG